MKYLYKKNKTYIYKRRLPYSKEFYYFDTKLKNLKKATKISILFNKYSANLFYYIKNQGKDFKMNEIEVIEILNTYKLKALKEYSELEIQRHKHLGEIFNIEKDDPIQGKIILNGAEPEVIKIALNSFKSLAIGNYDQTKDYLKSIGGSIINRSTLELKNHYRKLRNSRSKYNQIELLDFLSMLLKTEAEILKIEYKRAKDRFSNDFTFVEQRNDRIIEDNPASFLEDNISLSQIHNDFINNYCSYTHEQLSNSKSNAAKVYKITYMIIDYFEYENIVPISSNISKEHLRSILDLIPKIPMKPYSVIESYSFYTYLRHIYGNNLNKILPKEELRSMNTILPDIRSFFKFIKFCLSSEYITLKDFEELENHKNLIQSKVYRLVEEGKIKEPKRRVAIKDEMLKDIFTKDKRPYKILFDKLEENKLNTTDNINLLIARYYVPLILFFTGARVAEIAHLKTNDCLIKNNKLTLFVDYMLERSLKNNTSKRCLYIHEFLANDLNLINFIKKAQNEKREFIFNINEKSRESISKEFNRNKDYLYSENIDKFDTFFNLTYSLHSFRHLYKTHMSTKGLSDNLIEKMQGHSDYTDRNNSSKNYLTISEDLRVNINMFDKHKIINWVDFVRLSKKIVDNY